MDWHRLVPNLLFSFQRNYCLQLLQQYVAEKVSEGKEDELPTALEMKALATRKTSIKVGKEHPGTSKERMEALFLEYVNVLLPKVCGFKRWGPNQRCTGLVSTHEDEEGEPYVHKSDEAFLVVAWENSFEKWLFCAQRKAAKEDIVLDKLSDADKKKMETPYTDSKLGQKKFGGWLRAGRHRHKDLMKEIEQAKKGAHVVAVEEQVLKAVQAVHDWDLVVAKRNGKKMGKAKQEEENGEDTDIDFELDSE